MYHPERRWRPCVPSWSRTWVTLVTLVALLSATSSVQADDLSQKYCSSENTGSDLSPQQSIYQSNGRCTGNCTDLSGVAYAFAIVQGDSCWCSDYIPADQTPVGDCDTACVGYPFENCGNEDAGLYGYIQIGTPSGTAGPSSSSTTQAPTSSSTHTTAESTSGTTITESQTSSSTSSTRTPSPITSVQVLTISNQPVTQTVTSMPTTITASDPGAQQPIQQSSSKVSAGLIAGVVVAAVVAALAVAGLLFFCWRRRKHQELEAATEATMVGSGTTSTRPTRNTSVLSKTGLLEKVYPSAAMAQRANTNPNNASGGVSPISERRRSQPLFYDQRLNPTTLMNFDNGSRVSVNTLPDNRDFSRTLNVTNPDQHDSWQ